MMKFLSPLGRGFKDGLKEESPGLSTKWRVVGVLLLLALIAVKTSYPHPPADAGFLYSVGWYLSYVAGSVGNLFR